MMKPCMRMRLVSRVRSPLLMRTLLTKRIRMQGFIIFDDYGHRYPEFAKDMSQWLATGKIKFREDIVDGLENAPQALIGMLEGKNFSKLIVRVANVGAAPSWIQQSLHA